MHVIKDTPRKIEREKETREREKMRERRKEREREMVKADLNNYSALLRDKLPRFRLNIDVKMSC